MNKGIVAISGGFDPIHIGHVRLIQEAKKLGDILVVIVNNDNWLMKKKGFVFMQQMDRLEIVRAIEGVKIVVLSKHGKDTEDMSVCEELKIVKPEFFCNGGDRKSGNIPEYELCKRMGIIMKFNVGGGKVASSSDLVKNVNKKNLQGK